MKAEGRRKNYEIRTNSSFIIPTSHLVVTAYRKAERETMLADDEDGVGGLAAAFLLAFPA